MVGLSVFLSFVIMVSLDFIQKEKKRGWNPLPHLFFHCSFSHFSFLVDGRGKLLIWLCDHSWIFKLFSNADATSAHKIVILLVILGPLQNHRHRSYSTAGDSRHRQWHRYLKIQLCSFLFALCLWGFQSNLFSTTETLPFYFDF